MKGPWHRCILALCGLSAACDNTDLGVPSEPEGPLRVTRVTLLSTADTVRRPAPVFSDTSAPATCADNDPCALTTTRDLYGARLSPPNPDSATELRLVLDRVPVYVGERPLETPVFPPLSGVPDGMDTTLPPIDITLNVPDAISLTSPEGCGVPPLRMQVSIAGSAQTPNPVDIPYGPALVLALDEASDPLAGLEPGCRYQVQVQPGLAGRDRRPVDLSAAAALLTFQVEAPRVLRVGIGDDDHDAWYAAPPADPFAPSATPTTYAIDALPSDGVLRLRANAPLSADAVEALAVNASVDGVAVPALATLAQVGRDPVTMKPRCDGGDARSIFIYPRGGSWGAKPGALEVTINGARVFTLTQAPGHPASSTRSLAAPLTLRAALTGQPATMSYTGVLAAAVAQRGDAACGPQVAPDGGPSDAAAPQG